MKGRIFSKLKSSVAGFLYKCFLYIYKLIDSIPVKLFVYFLFTFTFIFFTIKDIIILDPDFGWHLKAGELMLQKGILFTDPFSFTMPSFPAVFHEWLTDILLYKGYVLFGTVGLALLQAFIITLVLILLTGKKMYVWTPVLLLLVISLLLEFSGIRPQVISWFFFAVLLKIGMNKEYWARWRYALPMLFVLWANMHGGFAIGIVTLLLITVTKAYEERKIDTQRILVLVLSVIATFINPYKGGLWREVWITASDPVLRTTVAEWKPPMQLLHLPLFALIPLAVILLYRYRQRFTISEIFLSCFFTFLCLSSIRNIPFFLIFIYPVVNKCFIILEKEIGINRMSVLRFRQGIQILKGTGVALLIFTLFLIGIIMRDYNESAYFPKQAVAYLNAISLKNKKIYSLYGWGGYLIWKLPGNKVFIDGRMPSWKSYSLPPGESNYALAEYHGIERGKESIGKAIGKYKIDMIIVPADHFNKEQFASEVIKAGFKNVYQDEKTVVFMK